MARDGRSFDGVDRNRLAYVEVEQSQQVRNRGQQSVLVDTRGAKKLDPVRLPSKLRERVEKAQRRAVAAKDGASSCNAAFSSLTSTNKPSVM